MSFDESSLFVSLIVSGIGFVLFMYGRKQQRPPQLIAGLVFMVYPYFVSSAWMMAGVGLAVGVALWWAIWMGW